MALRRFLFAGLALALFMQGPAGAQQLPAGAQQLPPGAQQLPPGAQRLPPGAQQLPPGAQQLPPSVLDQIQKAAKGRQGAAASGARSAQPSADDTARTTIISRPAQKIDRLTPFEDYVSSKLDFELTRFGADLVKEGEQTFAPNTNYVVPADYVIGPGDEIFIRAWGSLELDIVQIVDRRGRINLPTVGELAVAGLKYGALENSIRTRMGRAFKDFQVSASIGTLRGIRVYVTGFSAAPGSYAVSNLSTLLNLLLVSGGPSTGGSFRDIKLIRGGKTVSEFDLYQLLARGDKSKDLLLQPEDVIHVGPIGPQVAIAGAVGRPAIYEIKPGETLQDLILLSGGFSSAADRRNLRLVEIDRREVGFSEIPIADGKRPLKAGDAYLAVNLAVVDSPSHRKNIRVRLAGEVNKPGEYLLPPGSDLTEAIQAAGGVAPLAFPFGTIFTRESARREQEVQLNRVKLELEQTLLTGTARAPIGTIEDNAALARKNSILESLLGRIQTTAPTGRIVLGIHPERGNFPRLGLEDGDVVFIPRLPDVVGVFGSVVNPGIFTFDAGTSPEAILDRAGGPSATSDVTRTFVVRANGSVELFDRSRGNFLKGLRGGQKTLVLLPGDTIYVPEDIEPRTKLTTELRNWTQILSQFALGAAAIKVLRD